MLRQSRSKEDFSEIELALVRRSRLVMSFPKALLVAGMFLNLQSMMILGMNEKLYFNCLVILEIPILITRKSQT